MKIARIFVAVCAVLVFCAATAHAAKHDGPCKADREKFCKDVAPGGGAIAKCMKEHDADLSAACKANIKKHKEKWEATKAACNGDKEKFCKDVTPGHGAVRKCLKSHEGDLSAECKATFKK